MRIAVQSLCRRCVLSSSIPGVTLDETDLCNICQRTPDVEELREQREAARREMTAIITQTRGAHAYDCVVAFSGGKDSSYVLKMLTQQYNLRCLAVTIDNSFISDGTFGNCKTICGALGVDHIILAPNSNFMEKMYRESIRDESVHPPAAVQRASSICNSCISLINTQVLRVALQYGVPVIAGGYIGGQLPKDTAVLKLSMKASGPLRANSLQRFTRHFGEEATRYFALTERGEGRDEIFVINPMLGLSITEEEIIGDVMQLGWQRPTDTGVTSTNCRLNDLGVYVHTRRHGFHPYVFETADQVRHGLMSRDEALKKLNAIPQYGDVEWMTKRIGIGHNEI
jgi:tRNA(Ile)-lysidine synthase TilS/MesJ